MVPQQGTLISTHFWQYLECTYGRLPFSNSPRKKYIYIYIYIYIYLFAWNLTTLLIDVYITFFDFRWISLTFFDFRWISLTCFSNVCGARTSACVSVAVANFSRRGVFTELFFLTSPWSSLNCLGFKCNRTIILLVVYVIWCVIILASFVTGL